MHHARGPAFATALLLGALVAPPGVGPAVARGLADDAAASRIAPADVPVVGGCEGCEAAFDGLPDTVTSHTRLAPADEPGEPLALRGRVVDAAGRPRPGVILYAHQTDAGGHYPALPPEVSAGADARRHGRLRGWAVTDAEGRYGFDTVRPGGYPDAPIPQHIHLQVIEPGCATYYVDDVMFRDDPRVTPAIARASAEGRGGSGLVRPERVDGVWRVQRDIVLGRNVPDYRDCAAN